MAPHVPLAALLLSSLHLHLLKREPKPLSMPPPPPPTPGEVTKEEALPDTVGGMENAQAVSRC